MNSGQSDPIKVVSGIDKEGIWWLKDNFCQFSIKTYVVGTPGGGNSLYFVWYRRAAGIAPIFQVIYTSIGHDFISNIHL